MILPTTNPRLAIEPIDVPHAERSWYLRWDRQRTTVHPVGIDELFREMRATIELLRGTPCRG